MEDECLCPPCWVNRQRLLHLLAWNELLARASEGGAHPPGPPFPQGKLEHFLVPLFTLHWVSSVGRSEHSVPHSEGNMKAERGCQDGLGGVGGRDGSGAQDTGPGKADL